MTSLYSYRVYLLTFIARAHFFKQNLASLHESPLLMTISLVILSIASLVTGMLTKDFFVGLGSDF